MADSADSIQKYREILELDPGSRVFALLAEELCGAGRWEEAAEVCKKSLPFHPDNLRARTLLGWALMEMGETGESHQVLSKTVEEVRKNSAVFKRLSELAEIAGDTQKSDEYARLSAGLSSAEPAGEEPSEPARSKEASEWEDFKAEAIEDLDMDAPTVLDEPAGEAIEHVDALLPQDEAEVGAIETSDREAPTVQDEVAVETIMETPEVHEEVAAEAIENIEALAIHDEAEVGAIETLDREASTVQDEVAVETIMAILEVHEEAAGEAIENIEALAIHDEAEVGAIETLDKEASTVQDEAEGGAMENMVAPDLDDEAAIENMDAPDLGRDFQAGPKIGFSDILEHLARGFDERSAGLGLPGAVLSADDRDMLKEKIVALLGA